MKRIKCKMRLFRKGNVIIDIDAGKDKRLTIDFYEGAFATVILSSAINVDVWHSHGYFIDESGAGKYVERKGS